MNVLVSGHGADRDAVNAARRTVPYGRLVLLSARPDDEELARLTEMEALANVQVDVRAVDSADLMACLAAGRAVVEEHARDEVRVHVAGGPNVLTSALMLAAFQKGVEAFFCHPRGVSRLPVARSVDLAERFTDVERAVLVALPHAADARVADVAAGAHAPQTVKAALLRLRRAGLVRSGGDVVALTDAGRYYRAHFDA